MSEDLYKILGYDVGGTKISAVIGNNHGRIIKKIEKPTSKNLGQERLRSNSRKWAGRLWNLQALIPWRV